MAKAEYVVDEGWRHIIRIADGGLPCRLVKRMFKTKSLTLPPHEGGFTERPRLLEVLVSELAAEVIHADAEAWREGEADLVAGRCWRCSAIVFATPFEEIEDHERLARLCTQSVAVKLLLGGAYSLRGDEWTAGCFDCHDTAGRRA
jgi:hypothetical protein